MAKFIEVGDLEDALETMSGIAESIHRKRWPVGRKDPKSDTMFLNMLRELLKHDDGYS